MFLSHLLISPSEQFIPMLGLTQLAHAVDPETTIDKFLFLCKNAFNHAKPLTTTISFTAWFLLVALRSVKNRFKTRWYIYRIPEVLVVVLLSTCEHASSHVEYEMLMGNHSQSFLPSSSGIQMVLTSSATSTCIPAIH